ncbi:MAG: hypothetical protein NWR43_00855, partial [Alphaproteobacteria bacterium]|nr:hypothetical protein [Alphaproteobacteria bacterium]
SQEAQEAMQAFSNPFASSGFIRSNLHILHNKTANMNQDFSKQVVEKNEVIASASAGGSKTAILSPTITTTSIASTSSKAQIAEAKMKGFEGDSCGDCGNFTLVRNGTCMKCVTCGSTSGCS